METAQISSLSCMAQGQDATGISSCRDIQTGLQEKVPLRRQTVEDFLGAAVLSLSVEFW